MFDLIIIGSGPAGLSAAVYAQRALLKTILFEKDYGGTGQISTTESVDNYLGLPGISGYDMGETFREHAVNLGTKIVDSEVTDIQKTDNGFIVSVAGSEEKYETRTIIYAAGAAHKHIGCLGEREFSGKGVSYCATCDGAFYRGKTVAVVGGGDTAFGDALYLSKVAKKVYIIHRRDEFRANKSLQKQVLEKDNIKPLYSSVPVEISGTDKVNSIVLNNKKTNENYTVEVDGVFVAIGNLPNTKIVAEKLKDVELENGYIKANEDGITSLKGFFAAGDVRTKKLRQVITAASDGANAVDSVGEYLNN